MMFPPSSGMGRWRAAPLGAAKGSAGQERPCGKCVNCRVGVIAERSLRMQLEARCHAFAYFVTLTYSEESLPEGGTLVPSHLSEFMKRYRANLAYRAPGARVRFAGVGEYGDRTRRPHLHVILYNGDAQLELEPYKRSDRGQLLYHSELVQRSWQYGHNSVGAVTSASCDYVSGYLLKGKNRGSDAEYLRRSDPLTGEVWQVHPEFGRYSTQPGLGAPFFQRWPGDIVGSDGSFGITLRGGERRPVPSYFFRLLKRNSDRISRGLAPIDGLEAYGDADAVVQMKRTEWHQESAARDLLDVRGDRLLLAAMRREERERVEDCWRYRLSQRERTL